MELSESIPSFMRFGWNLLRIKHEGQVPSSETQGQIAEARGSLNRQKKTATKKSIVGREEPLGTRSYQTSSKQYRSFSILIGARNSLCFSAQSEVSRARSRFGLLEEKSLNHTTKCTGNRSEYRRRNTLDLSQVSLQ